MALIDDAIAYYGSHATIPQNATKDEKIMWHIGKLATYKADLKTQLDRLFTQGQTSRPFSEWHELIGSLFSLESMVNQQYYEGNIIAGDNTSTLRNLITNWLEGAKLAVSNDEVAVADRWIGCKRVGSTDTGRFDGNTSLMYVPAPSGADWQLAEYNDAGSGYRMTNCFRNCTSLMSVPYDADFYEEHPDFFANVTNFNYAFQGCSVLKTKLKLNVASATSMGLTFYGCGIEEIELVDMGTNVSGSQLLSGSKVKSIKGLNMETELPNHATFYNTLSLSDLRLKEGSYILRMCRPMINNANGAATQLSNARNLNAASLKGVIDHLYDWRNPSNNARQYNLLDWETTDNTKAVARCLSMHIDQVTRLNIDPIVGWNGTGEYWLKTVHAKGWFATGSTTNSQAADYIMANSAAGSDLNLFGQSGKTLAEWYEDEDYLNPTILEA